MSDPTRPAGGTRSDARPPAEHFALPDFPWDTLAPYKARAATHPGGLVDLSVGTPVDPTPLVVRQALIAAADAPGYPQTHGTCLLYTSRCE